MKKKAPKVHQLTIAQFEQLFPDEIACKQYLADNRWPEGVKCPRCGSEKVSRILKRDQYDCAARLALIGDVLVVGETGNCGGAGVNFTGFYRIKR